MLLDLKDEIQKTTDLGLLSLVLQGLTGEKCLGAKLSYADEFQLHFGELQPARHPKMLNHLRGSWILTTRASSWRAWLPKLGVLVTSGISWERPEWPAKDLSVQEMVSMVNTKLNGIEVRFVDVGWFHPSSPLSPGLVLGFADGSRFELAPDPEELMDQDEPIADWELFTPYKTYLRVGPGVIWSLSRSDVPQDA